VLWQLPVVRVTRLQGGSRLQILRRSAIVFFEKNGRVGEFSETVIVVVFDYIGQHANRAAITIIGRVKIEELKDDGYASQTKDVLRNALKDAPGNILFAGLDGIRSILECLNTN
jgi:hypothetical protein